MLGWFKRRLDLVRNPEWRFQVMISGEQLTVTDDRGRTSTLRLDSLRRVSVETNDSGPAGLDVWFVLEDDDGFAAFPNGAIGGGDCVARLRTLPGFRLRGMDSTRNQRFECWPDPNTNPESTR